MSVRPKKQLGQHFLADANILGVIGRLAELGPDDVALEIGPGLGVLTGYLAERVRHVHAVELDRSLARHLRELEESPLHIALSICRSSCYFIISCRARPTFPLGGSISSSVASVGAISLGVTLK